MGGERGYYQCFPAINIMSFRLLGRPVTRGDIADAQKYTCNGRTGLKE
jgi:hypothetical protein